jgi:cell division septation protein DedD
VTPSPTPPQKFPGSPPPPANAEKKTSAGEMFFVQVNSFSTHDNAAKEVAKLRSLKITGTILDAPGGGAHFKVRVGPLDRTAADALKARLSKQGYKPSVIPR